MRRTTVLRCALLGSAALLAGCAAHYTADSIEDPFGLFSGIWHGIVFPLALLANLLSWVLGLVGISFLDLIQLIGRPNTGLWYYVGFAFGICSWGGAGAS